MTSIKNKSGRKKTLGSIRKNQAKEKRKYFTKQLKDELSATRKPLQETDKYARKEFKVTKTATNDEISDL